MASPERCKQKKDTAKLAVKKHTWTHKSNAVKSAGTRRERTVTRYGHGIIWQSSGVFNHRSDCWRDTGVTRTPSLSGRETDKGGKSTETKPNSKISKTMTRYPHVNVESGGKRPRFWHWQVLASVHSLSSVEFGGFGCTSLCGERWNTFMLY